MSAKLLQALTEDSSDLQKQIGCMTGIFQIFDRQNALVTARRITNHSHSRILSDHSHLNNGNRGGDTDNGRYFSSSVTERQRVPAESSRTSISSSSSSSSFSSVNCKNVVRAEIPQQGNIFSETSSKQLRSAQQNASPQLRQPPLDFRDAVKDSIYKEACGTPAKTMTKEETMNRVEKHRNAIRPFQLSESVDGSYKVGNYGMSGMPADFSESLRLLSRLREGHGSLNDTKEPPRSSYEGRHGSSFVVPRDAPRFSYDGQEMSHTTFESRGSLKSNTKFKEHPRMSLDSSECSMKRTNSAPRSNSNSNVMDLQRDSGASQIAQRPLQEAGMHVKQHSNVVAKLMGLELMPTSQTASEGQWSAKAYPNRDIDSFSRPSECRAPSSPRSLFKEPTSPRSKNSNLIMKPISSSPFPIEPAPWRQLDGTRGVQRPAGRNHGNPTSSSLTSPSVYGNIERRLRELEYKQLDGDLRTLEHMLDTMQENELYEIQREEDQASNFELEINYNKQNHSDIDRSFRLINGRNPENSRPVAATSRPSSPAESPIVIMKPAKSARTLVNKVNGISTAQKLVNGDSADCRKGAVNGRVAKNLRPKVSQPVRGRDSDNGKKANAMTSNSAKTSTRSQQLPREKTLSSTRSSGSASPKIYQKRPQPERQARPPVPSPDLSTTKKQSVRKSGSSSGKRRTKSPTMRQKDDNTSKISNETRSLSYQGDEVSLCSDSNFSSASQMDVEVTSADRSGEMSSMFIQQDSLSPSSKVPSKFSSPVEQKSYMLSEDAQQAELMAATPEQPSPVSVLDASFYRDDLSSPDEKTQNLDEYHVEEQNPTDLDHLHRGRKKLENVEHLVQKLRRLNSSHDESKTDYIASLCENSNPDHRYVSEILLASGLLLGDLESGLMSLQPHPSGHPINPDLFYVLEQTKTSNNYLTGTEKSCEEDAVASNAHQQEKLHRKLVFDSVNEILEHKLDSVGPLLNPWLQSNKLAGRTLNAQQLLRDLCSEIEKLIQGSENSACNFDGDDFLKNILFKDVVSVSHKWAVSNGEVSGVVLDVEKLMFKDLIDEIVNSEIIARQTRRCRQLFAM
ncbi:protein LONGIFOLIA 1-like isoform X2 [Papaver somniferum]|uniref:protein LONGIFOLIA 1-like isoform X2 n=1 Tax=Papaver somniferum TaxID=3469 RepID=UPI000E702192|nr:protein LONGIFOLIA 1-like isoform X2 [Papaver somniferum]